MLISTVHTKRFEVNIHTDIAGSLTLNMEGHVWLLENSKLKMTHVANSPNTAVVVRGARI